MNRRVVVTGMGVISPIGNNLEEFWNALLEGKCGIGPITKFDTTEYKAKLAAEVKDFNARDYMEKAEMLRSDLYAQYGLASACQAVEDSKIIGTVEPERIGVYYGTGIGGMDTFMTEHKKLIEKGTRKVSPYFVPMMIANMASGMIAIRFNCKGAAMPSVTACASGSNAIGEALRAIRHGYLDAVITGGAEAPINECGVSGFVNMQALSTAENPNEASLPFDSRRGGFVIGEGGAALVLEEYEHAVARGAKIYAEIVGSGLTADAYHITAPHPDGDGAMRVMKNAIEEAGISPTDVDYINVHGTSTYAGDIAEIKAIKTLFGEHAYKLNISSTKSMTGHLLGAAGAIEAMLTVLAIKNGIVPPTINHEEGDEDPEIDYALNFTFNKAQKRDIKVAISNTFGFGGHNATICLKKYEG